MQILPSTTRGYWDAHDLAFNEYDFALKEGAPITRWRTGAEGGFSLATSSIKPPLYDKDTLGGPSALFYRSPLEGQLMQSASRNLDVVVVLQTTHVPSSSDSQYDLIAQASGIALRLSEGGYVSLEVFGETLLEGRTVVNDGSPHVVRAMMREGQVYLYVDWKLDGRTEFEPRRAGGRQVTLANIDTRMGRGDYLYIGMVLVASSLTAQERDRVQAYIARKWGAGGPGAGASAPGIGWLAILLLAGAGAAGYALYQRDDDHEASRNDESQKPTEPKKSTKSD